MANPYLLLFPFHRGIKKVASVFGKQVVTVCLENIISILSLFETVLN